MVLDSQEKFKGSRRVPTHRPPPSCCCVPCVIVTHLLQFTDQHRYTTMDSTPCFPLVRFYRVSSFCSAVRLLLFVAVSQTFLGFAAVDSLEEVGCFVEFV